MTIVSQLSAVVAVLALLGTTLWFLRRRGIAGTAAFGNRRRRRMECLERLPLGPQHTLHCVRVGGTLLLLASSPAGCTVVQTTPWNEATQ